MLKWAIPDQARACFFLFSGLSAAGGPSLGIGRTVCSYRF